MHSWRCNGSYRHDWRLVGLLPAVIALGCGGKQTGGEGDASEDQPSEVVENTPTQPAPNEEEEPEGGGATPRPTPHAEALDSCDSSTWTGPDEPKLEAGCSQVWEESGDEPRLRYVCSCDLDACPIYSDPIDDGDPDTPPEVALNDCVVDGVAEGCEASLEEACGLTTGRHGYCEHPYYGLVPTRPGQDPPDAFTVVCFEAEDGTHACQCPGADELVPTEDVECNQALMTACQAPCETSAGQCEPTASGYECNCTAGFARSVETGLCDYALFWSCEPACANEAGACYWDPSGGPEIICLCDGESEPQVMVRDPDVAGDECRTPLVETCGGSAE